MSGDLEEASAAALPGSVTLPAGAGKTHLLAGTAQYLVATGGKVLVLTHTNAGVHAIRKRLKELNVFGRIRVSTLASFAFLLARSYPRIGERKVPAVPNWSDSADYVNAAVQIAKSETIGHSLAASFTHALVDEYQDCSDTQHAFVCALADRIPATGILGDPMQAIFGFKDTRLVKWNDALRRFPEHKVTPKPWRWVGQNEDLGAWLFNIRENLKPGVTIDFSAVPLPTGVEFRSSAGDYWAVARAARVSRPPGETVLVIAPWKSSVRDVASTLSGTYTVMEEIAGDFITDRLTELAALSPDRYAIWLFDLTKKCYSGHQKLNKVIRKRLAANATTSDLHREGLTEALAAFDDVITNPTYAALVSAMRAVRRAEALKLHSDEAWYDILTAIRGAAAAGDDSAVLLAELNRTRDRVRHNGRQKRNRVVSRTVLVKGLEYDHVVISDITKVADANNLYVALTRARKSITILGTSSTITVTKT